MPRLDPVCVALEVARELVDTWKQGDEGLEECIAALSESLDAIDAAMRAEQEEEQDDA